jgi:hypothetical protein
MLADTNTAGSVIVVELVLVQPLLSVMVTVYVPATKLVAELVEAPLLQAYV